MRIMKVRIFKPDVRYRIDMTPQEAYEFQQQVEMLGIKTGIIGAIATILREQKGSVPTDVNEEDIDDRNQRA